MFRFLYGTIVLLIAASFWIYIFFFDGLSANSKRLEKEIDQYKKDLVISKQTIAKKNDRISDIEKDVEDYRSELEEIKKDMIETKAQLNQSNQEKDALNKRVEDLKKQLSTVDDRIMEEKNRADTLEELNSNMARSLDNSLQEVRRLQTIIRTLSNN